MYICTCIYCYVFVCVYNYYCELNNHSGVNSILSVDDSNVGESSAILISKLPCSSPGLRSVMLNLMNYNTDVKMDVDLDVNMTNTTGIVPDPELTYSYPTHVMTVKRLNSSTTYYYCIMAINSTNTTNTTDMLPVGLPVCGNFTTAIITKSHECEYIAHLIIFCPLIN